MWLILVNIHQFGLDEGRTNTKIYQFFDPDTTRGLTYHLSDTCMGLIILAIIQYKVFYGFTVFII